jgi:hypothetical protein
VNAQEQEFRALIEEDMHYANILIQQSNYRNAAALLKEASNLLTAVNTIQVAKTYN